MHPPYLASKKQRREFANESTLCGIAMAAARAAGFFREAEGFGEFGRPPGARTAGAGAARSGSEPVDEAGQGHRQSALGRQVSGAADAVPAGGAEQLDHRFDCAGAGGKRGAAWHRAGGHSAFIRPGGAGGSDSRLQGQQLEARCRAFCARLSRSAVEALPGRCRGLLRHRAGRHRLLAGASRRHQGQFECRLHLSDLRSAGGNALWQPGPRSAGHDEKPHRRHQPRVGRVCSRLGRRAAGCGRDSRRQSAWPTGTTRNSGTWPSSPSPTNSFRSMPIMLPAPSLPSAARAERF